MWLLIMCYDIFSTFSGHNRQRGASADIRRFRKYCVTAVTVPVLLTSALAIIDNSGLDEAYILKMGEEHCTPFSAKRKWTGLYLYVPIMVITGVSFRLFKSN